MKKRVRSFVLFALATVLWACDGTSEDETRATLVRQLTLQLSATEKRLRFVMRRQSVGAKRLEEAEKRLAVLASYYLSIERKVETYIVAREVERQHLQELEKSVFLLRHTMVDNGERLERSRLELYGEAKVRDRSLRWFCVTSSCDLCGREKGPMKTCSRANRLWSLRMLSEKLDHVSQFVFAVDRRLMELQKAVNGKVLVLSARLRGLKQLNCMPTQKRH